MASAIQNQVTSTKRLSELLVLNIVNQLGSASLAAVHHALRGATNNAKSPFYIGKSLRGFLEDSAHINVSHQGTSPKYQLTSTGRVTAVQNARVVNSFFPHFHAIPKSKPVQR
jgi:hypothetical protein